MSEQTERYREGSDEYEKQDPLIIAAGVHGQETDALNVAKIARTVPNVVPMVGNYRAINANVRWEDGDRNMSGQFPGDPSSPLYSSRRAWMMTRRIRQTSHSGIVEYHSSIADTEDLGWICIQRNQDPDLKPDYCTPDFTVLRLIHSGITKFVVSGRLFNLLGEGAAIIDTGIYSPWKNPKYCRDNLFWMANEYDPEFDRLYHDFTGEDMPVLEVYEHAGWVPHAERRRVGLPKTMDTLEPIDPDAAHELRLPPGSCALSWGGADPDSLPAAGEVLVPYTRRLPGVLGMFNIRMSNAGPGSRVPFAFDAIFA